MPVAHPSCPTPFRRPAVGTWGTWILVAFCLALTLATGRAAAIVNGEEAPTEDQRFDAIGLLIASLPGEPGCEGTVVGTCTLVDHHLVMTAAHCLLRTDGTFWPPEERTFWVRFRRGINGQVTNSFPGGGCTSDYQELRVVAMARANNADLAVCTLEYSPRRVTPISIEYRDDPAPSDPILVSGWGFAGECLGGGDPWRLRWASGTLSSGPQGSLLAINECVFSPCVHCVRSGGGGEGESFQGWAVPNMHDSGAPVLREVACSDGSTQLRLVGVVMTPNYAVRALQWHDSGTAPALFSTYPCDRCPADHNGDGATTVTDVFAYLADFMSGHPRADADGAAGVTVQDVFAYLVRFFAGC